MFHLLKNRVIWWCKECPIALFFHLILHCQWLDMKLIKRIRALKTNSAQTGLLWVRKQKMDRLRAFLKCRMSTVSFPLLWIKFKRIPKLSSAHHKAKASSTVLEILSSRMILLMRTWDNGVIRTRGLMINKILSNLLETLCLHLVVGVTLDSSLDSSTTPSLIVTVRVWAARKVP